jgi:hypothetical protein
MRAPAVLREDLVGLGLVSEGVDVAFLEHALGDEDRVQYAWESRVGDAVEDCLDYLAGGQADVQTGVDVDLELRLCATERSERGDGDELSLPQVERWALIDLAVRELDDVSTEVGSDVFEALDHAFAALGVNLDETLPTALETFALLCLSCHSVSLFRRLG